jgi:general secretion pathway protein B
MSYILEALKKSSEERARLVSAVPPAAPALASAGHTTRRSAWWLLAGIGVGALAVIAFIGMGALAPEIEPDRSPKPSPVAAEPVTAPVQLDEIAAPSTASLKRPPLKHSDAEIPPRVVTVDAPSPPPKKLAARPPLPPPPAAPTTPAASLQPEAQPNSRNEMPPELLKQVLAIPISAHIYSSKAAERMIIIDGRGVREGDSLPSGVLVEQITPTGISVSYKGYRANKPVN